MSTMLFQGFHLHCVQAPSFLTSIELLEGIEDISPSDVAIIERWIETGVARGMVSCMKLPTRAVHLHMRGWARNAGPVNNPLLSAACELQHVEVRGKAWSSYVV